MAIFSDETLKDIGVTKKQMRAAKRLNDEQEERETPQMSFEFPSEVIEEAEPQVVAERIENEEESK